MVVVVMVVVVLVAVLVLTVGAVGGKPFPRPSLSHTGSSVYSQLTQALGLLLYALQQWAQGGNTVNIMIFLAVQNSSIGVLVTDSFTFDIQRATLETP